MSQYRIQFFGSLLVDSDSVWSADVAAHAWTVSMKQATHGIAVQPVPPAIKALDFCIERPSIRDVTAEFHAAAQANRQKVDPQMRQMAINLTNYFVGLQPDWEEFEFDRMRPKNNEPPNA